tara:strand:- start:1303 stop:1680 length:378 start_codon:yes stop_codon:yes gene_type:complete
MEDDDTEFDSLSGFLYSEDEFIEPVIKKKHNRKAKKGDQGYEIIRAALESHLVEYAKRKQDQKRNVDQLSTMIEEYLSSFVLLGYNYDGDPVTIVSASTQQHSDSLSTLIQKFIINSNPGNTPGV